MQTVDDVTHKCSCMLFTRSHAGHLSKLTEVFLYLYLLNGDVAQNVLANVMNLESDGLEMRQTDSSS